MCRIITNFSNKKTVCKINCFCKIAPSSVFFQLDPADLNIQKILQSIPPIWKNCVKLRWHFNYHGLVLLKVKSQKASLDHLIKSLWNAIPQYSTTQKGFPIV